MQHTARQTSIRTYDDLKQAMDRRTPVTITALKEERDTNGRRTGHLVETVRTIEIFAIEPTLAGNIVIKAMDRDSGQCRSFRLDRLLTYTVHRRSRYVLTPPARTHSGIPGVRVVSAVLGDQLDPASARLAREAAREDRRADADYAPEDHEDLTV